jgi:aminoglycoside phosphotransferase (APT) family kinase protein
VIQSINGPPNGLDQVVDQNALTKWLASEIEGWTNSPVTIELASGGRSNLTFFVTQGERHAVLRRPPLGHVLPSAHDMEREYRVLNALADTEVPVPNVYGLCTDSSVIGSKFYLMQRIDGRTLSEAADTANLTNEEAAQLSADFVEVLTRIHAVDYQARGLENFGRPNGYITRQVQRWVQQWQHSATQAMPEMDLLVSKLQSRIPDRSLTSLVHGDYRLDNLLIAHAPQVSPRAVVDWEMSTLGDPLADVGLMLVYWSEPGDAHSPSSVATQIAGNSGFLTRRELVNRYALITGANVDELPFYVALGYFKLAVIFQSINRRYLLGQTLGDGFESLGLEVPLLVDRALETLAKPFD